MTIHEEYRQSSNLPRFSRSTLGDGPSGDRFVALSYDPTVTLCYEPERWTHDDLIRDLERLLRSAGPTDPCKEKRFAGLDVPITVKHRLEYKNDAPSSAENINDSSIRRLSQTLLPEACPPLDSDHEGSSDGTEDGDAATTTEAASGEPPSLSRESRSIDTTLRRVFSSEPSFAERVIAAVNRLPTDKRELLVGYDTECVDGSSSGPSKSGDRPSKKRRTLGKRSNQGGNRSRPNGDGDTRGDDGEDNGEEEGDGTSSSTTLRRSKKNPGWNCPYHLVYLWMHHIPQFKHCSSMNMIEKSEWRWHLSNHHSPTAKGKDRYSEKHAKFYMSEEKFTAVMEEVDSYTERPRESKERTDKLKELFDRVWCTIFPKHEFPNLKMPLSPFHIVGGEIADLEQHLASRAEILVKTILETKADEAFAAGTIRSTSDYQPALEQTKDILSKALAAILRHSPAAAGATQWLARAPLDTIQVAGRQHSDGSPPRPLSNHHDEQAVARDNTPAIPPTPTTRPEMPQLAHGGLDAMAISPVTLFPRGTILVLKPCIASLPQDSTAKAYLSLPSTHYVAGTDPILLPPGPMGMSPMMNQTSYGPNNVTQMATGFMIGTDGQFAPALGGGQNGAMQMMQNRSTGTDAWNP